MSSFADSVTLDGESLEPSARDDANQVGCLARKKPATGLSTFLVQEKTESNSIEPTVHLKWYDCWLQRQLSSIPRKTTNHLGTSFDVTTVFFEVAKFAKEEENLSIDKIARHLLCLDLVRPQDTVDGQAAVRTLAFAILGWQTLLYLPSFGTCPPQQLALMDTLDGFEGQAFMTLKQDACSAARSLPDFLLGYGLMLPKGNICISEDMEDKKAFDNLTMIDSRQFNASLLQSIAKVNVVWVDVLSPHLEFDKATNTLFLFRHPSFCVANIPSSADAGCKGVIHCCASKVDNASVWGSETDITQLLQEILLSYRLLFGQDKGSRRLFRKSNPFAELRSEERDPLLDQFCGRKNPDSLYSIHERDSYRLRRDFPILRNRIATVHQYLSSSKPQGWRQLWQDKRDIAPWYTFWAVIIIGASGLLLSILQVALQAAELASGK